MKTTSPARVEAAVREVYAYSPPTETHFAAEGRAAYEQFWKRFMADLGVGSFGGQERARRRLRIV